MFIIYLLFLIISNIINSSENETMIFAEIHFRHGARAPSSVNENGQDALGIEWSNPGELTPIGERMQYLLGLRNRQKYITRNKFISDIYDPHELIVFSSNVNRTLQSVSSQLQGFYPASSGRGDKLSKEQYDKAIPPFNFSKSEENETKIEIENEKINLNDSALPNYMTIIPIHYIGFTNFSINCTEKVKNIINNNNNKQSVINYVDAFNKNFSKQFNEYLNNTEGNLLNFSYIIGLCDAVYADHFELKNTTSFYEKINISENDLMQNCHEALTIRYRDIYFGDEKNEYILYYNSYILNDMINYMKRRIEDDINGDISKNNISDYSRPRMVFLSGHDTTLSAQQMFFIKFFNLELKSFMLPGYSSQISFEVTRKNISQNLTNTLKYSDYTVKYYFDNSLILSLSFDKFLEKVEQNLWDYKKTQLFCLGEVKKPVDKSNKIIIFMGALIFILTIVVIVLIFLLLIKNKNKNKNKKPITENFINDKSIQNEKIINDDDD